MSTARDSTQPILEDWKIYPWFGFEVAEGDIYNDTRWPDGTRVYTSAIVKKDGDFLKTRNTLYKLGTPAEEPKSTQA